MPDVLAPGFLLPAGPAGVLLLHGFTASPTEMRPLGEHLHRAGYTALGVRLAGHGTCPEDLARCGWREWLRSAEDGLRQLEKQCERIVVVGLSMGAVLAVLLAADAPGRVRAISLLAPAFRLWTRWLGLAAWVAPAIPAIDKGEAARGYLDRHGLFSYPVMPTRSLAELHRLIRAGWGCLSRASLPVQVVVGARDRTVRSDSSLAILRRLPDQRRSLVVLPGSDHILTVEPEAADLFAAVAAFVSAHTVDPGPDRRGT